jgi:hypothetical protein
MKHLVLLFSLVAGIVAGTVLFGWWTVPVVSAALTLAMPRRGGVMIAAFGGALAWAFLLMLVRRNGPVGALDRVLSGTLQMPPGSGIALTIVYAALLAGAAALIAQSIRVPRSARETANASSRSS